MEQSLDWFKDEEFWLRFAPIMFDSQRWEETAWETENLLKLVPQRAAATILDSCCGVGRHALEFARRGFQVTGVDLTRPYIEAARESAAAEKLPIEFLIQDVRSFSRPDSFNLALNLFTSFGFFSSQREELDYLRNILRSLRAGGSLVIDVNGKEILARDFKPVEEYEMDGYRVRGEYCIADDFSRLENHWSLVPYNNLGVLGDGGEQDMQTYRFSFSHRIYSAVELRELLLEAGFNTVRIYGDFDGRPYDNEARRLITVATC